MVMNGHTHSYERGEMEHVHYLVSGGGGGGLDDYFVDYDHITFSDMVHHFTRIDVDNDELHVTATDQYGNVVDRFTVNKFVQVSIQDNELPQALDFVDLEPGYPNPATDTTAFVYRIAQETRVKLELFDLTGRKLSTLVDQFHPVGTYKVVLDTARLANGTYVVCLLYTSPSPRDRTRSRMPSSA